MNNPFIDNMKNFMGQNNMNNFASDLMTRNVETLTAAAQLASKTAQNLMSKNTAMMQESSRSMFDGFKSMSNNNSPEQLMRNAQESMKDSVETLVSNSKEFTESLVKTGTEMFELFSKRTQENMNELMTQMSSATKNSAQQFASSAASADKKK